MISPHLIATHLIAATALIALSGPAEAAWQATTPQAEQASKDAAIAEVLMARSAMDVAILAKDVDGFMTAFSDDTVVNNPYNKIARIADARRNMETGKIDYTSLDHRIEYAAKRANGEVILMGEEHYTPIGASAGAGKQVKRRTTELWSKDSGRWKLVLRQATIYEAK